MGLAVWLILFSSGGKKISEGQKGAGAEPAHWPALQCSLEPYSSKHVEHVMRTEWGMAHLLPSVYIKPASRHGGHRSEAAAAHAKCMCSLTCDCTNATHPADLKSSPRSSPTMLTAGAGCKLRTFKL